MSWEVILNSDEEIGLTVSRYLFEEASKRNLSEMIFKLGLPDGAFIRVRQVFYFLSFLSLKSLLMQDRDFSFCSICYLCLIYQSYRTRTIQLERWIY
ncbi:Uncharacterized protein PRO82_000154 [Candidatus Protochlamydia amoebophila]|nr:Uncharacterized protein [Candidatus Protochlamydia amoebophila]